MDHPLELQYGLTAYELLEAVNKRFRLKVALEGAVAEIQMEKVIVPLVGTVSNGTNRTTRTATPTSVFGFRAEGAVACRVQEYPRPRASLPRRRGIVAYKVETQKTRASQGDPVSRYYGVEQFQILGVCLGKKTGDWTDFHIRPGRGLAMPRQA